MSVEIDNVNSSNLVKIIDVVVLFKLVTYNIYTNFKANYRRLYGFLFEEVLLFVGKDIIKLLYTIGEMNNNRKI